MVVTLQEAQANLPELIRDQPSGQEVEITDNGKSIAKLIVLPKPERKVPRLGTMKGTVLSMERFDEPLEEFEEYM
jgi:antitoxin (DNA-binding transcriptional repressor) of toxin-antitoxin stability system